MDAKIRPVVPNNLYRFIDLANRIVVCESPTQSRIVLFESEIPAEIDDFKESVQVHDPDESFQCLCIGTPVIYLYRGSKQLVQITNHHGNTIRCSLWDSDAYLVSEVKWIKWFEDRDIRGPGREIELKKNRQDQMDDYLRWTKAMPTYLLPIWDRGDDNRIDIKPLNSILERKIADKNSRILALLKWYGFGAGPWSEFPAYERAAEEMLLEYQPSEVVIALDSLNYLSKSVLEGAARLFCGWYFGNKYPTGLTEIPNDMKSRLWDHVKISTDYDKKAKGKQAFINEL